MCKSATKSFKGACCGIKNLHHAENMLLVNEVLKTPSTCIVLYYVADFQYRIHPKGMFTHRATRSKNFQPDCLGRTAAKNAIKWAQFSARIKPLCEHTLRLGSHGCFLRQNWTWNPHCFGKSAQKPCLKVCSHGFSTGKQHGNRVKFCIKKTLCEPSLRVMLRWKSFLSDF